jgi:hypothetical protein
LHFILLNDTHTHAHARTHAHTHTHTHILCGIPVDEGSALRKDNLTAHNIHEGQTAMLSGFEPAIPAGERPQTNASELAATGIGSIGLSTI